KSRSKGSVATRCLCSHEHRQHHLPRLQERKPRELLPDLLLLWRRPSLQASQEGHRFAHYIPLCGLSSPASIRQHSQRRNRNNPALMDPKADRIEELKQQVAALKARLEKV